MLKNKDKTLIDNNRNLLNFQKAEIESVLPEYFVEDNPKLIELFEKYYEWMDSDGNPDDRIKRLYASRDATQVPDRNLQYLEDELLLGQAYFGGFQNKREAVKFSNLLYRSKGTKYSIEQFFRAFFGVDPQVIYPKENIFRVGPMIDYDQSGNNNDGGQIKEEASVIGPESRKFLTDDKLYQVLSVLIRADISVTEWLDVYKLFVHPAGVYLGSELLIVSSNEVGIPFLQEEVGSPVAEQVGTAEQASVGISTFTADTTLLVKGDSDGLPIVRQIERQNMEYFQNVPAGELLDGYRNFGEFLSPNSKAFSDSDGGTTTHRDFATMSDSSLDNPGTIDGDLLKKQSFDLHKYTTDYDSDYG